MRAYEIVHILDAALDREAVDAKLETFLATLGGEVTAVDHWGVRQLAYPIRKSATGYYVIVQVTADPTALPEFERLLKLDEETMRYLIVLDEGQPTSGASILADRRPPAKADAGDGGEDGGEQSDAGGAEGEGGEGAADGDAEDGDDEDGAEDAPGDQGDGDGADADADDQGAGDGADADSDDGGDGNQADDGDGNGADAEEAGDADGGGAEASDAAEASGTEAEAPPEPSGPPIFTGARGRRRRHEGPPVVLLNYKDVATLSSFLTEQGKILPKRTTKVTARFQRQLGTAVKRARHLALLPYIRDHGS